MNCAAWKPAFTVLAIRWMFPVPNVDPADRLKPLSPMMDVPASSVTLRAALMFEDGGIPFGDPRRM
jgi:hypothetical protein